MGKTKVPNRKAGVGNLGSLRRGFGVTVERDQAAPSRQPGQEVLAVATAAKRGVHIDAIFGLGGIFWGIFEKRIHRFLQQNRGVL